MTIQEQFLQKTRINPEYFLLKVLDTLGQIKSNDNITNPIETTIYPINESGRQVGKIEMFNNIMLIRKSE